MILNEAAPLQEICLLYHLRLKRQCHFQKLCELCEGAQHILVLFFVTDFRNRRVVHGTSRLPKSKCLRALHSSAFRLPANCRGYILVILSMRRHCVPYAVFNCLIVRERGICNIRTVLHTRVQIQCQKNLGIGILH